MGMDGKVQPVQVGVVLGKLGGTEPLKLNTASSWWW